MLIKRQRAAIRESETSLRDSLWPGADGQRWHQDDGGFVIIPKTMPYICRILDEMSKNFPLGSTYQALWSFTWSNDAFVKFNKVSEIAYAAGFTGQRGQRTLYDRMKRLQELGFIEAKPSGNDRFGYIFIPNPHRKIIEIKRARDDLGAPKALRDRASLLQESSLTAFIARAIEIHCKDVMALLADYPAEQDKEESETPKKESPRRPKEKT